MEERILYRLEPWISHHAEGHRATQGGEEEDADIEGELVVEAQLPPTESEKIVEQRHIDPTQEHENRQDTKCQVAIATHAELCGHKATRGHRAQGKTEGVEHAIASQYQQSDEDECDKRIDAPHAADALGDMGMEFALLGAGELGRIELERSLVETLKECDDKEDKSQATNPLCDGTPHQHPLRDDCGIGNDGGASGGEAGDRLEGSIGESPQDTCKKIGQGSGQRHHKPCYGCNPETFAFAQTIGSVTPHDITQQQTDSQQHECGKSQGILCTVTIVERHHHG